ncbi:hypothetical protein THICB3560297 [Thiomonas sp. CB3]|nr:hypothetical protein THICB3560297 [Thiomonas sp. CB3]
MIFRRYDIKIFNQFTNSIQFIAKNKFIKISCLFRMQ